MIVFCIGNGESRKDIDLNKIKDYGFIAGCNALYRDFIPDLLVAVNQKMIDEVKKSGFNGQFAHMRNIVDCKGKLKKVMIIDNYREWFIGHPSDGEMFIDTKYPAFFGEVPGWSSGSLSVLLSINMVETNNVFLIGHDFFSDTGVVNNMYKGTSNYANNNANLTFGGNWIKELREIFLKNPNIEFYRVGREFDKIDEWSDIKNVKLISIDNTWNLLKHLKEYNSELIK